MTVGALELGARYDRAMDALYEILTICTESAGACRKRMGTRVGNATVAAQHGLGEHKVREPGCDLCAEEQP